MGRIVLNRLLSQSIPRHREEDEANYKVSLDHPFALADADGKAMTSADFPGKWLLIYFGYTHCSDQCPTALSAMAEALDEIGPAASLVQPLFVTVDPERDRGPMLRNFTAAFDKRLIGLTGTREQTTDFAHAPGVKYEKETGRAICRIAHIPVAARPNGASPSGTREANDRGGWTQRGKNQRPEGGDPQPCGCFATAVGSRRRGSWRGFGHASSRCCMESLVAMLTA